MSTPLISATDVSISFGGVQALDNVSLDVPAGGRLAIIGPNGAGKSTLVNVLTRFVKPDSGTVLFDGERVSSPAHAARKGLMRTFQNLELFDSMTVLENIRTTFDGIARHRGIGRVSRDQARAALDTFGLGHRADDVVASLPYGIRKLLELTRVVAAQPRLLLLDEPVAGLTNKAEYVDTLAAALDELGTAVILIEHDMDTVKRLADQVVVLDSGKVIATGTYEEVSRDERVIGAYLGALAEG